MSSKPIYCHNCSGEITSKWGIKFCSKSCSAEFNNKGVRRHGNPPNDCANPICSNKTTTAASKYCSNKCHSNHRFGNKTEAEKLDNRRRTNRSSQALYHARKKHQSPDLTSEEKSAIKELYYNCPEGYEVDHIIPIAKGGLHKLDNLQYLTISENRSKGDKLNWSRSSTG